MKTRPSISVFFPCYNDAGTIGILVKKATEILKREKLDFEVIVIDDGSTDKSRQILKRLSKTNKKLKLVLHEKNRGYGGAIRSGFDASSKDLIFYTDGDAQYDIAELPILLTLLSDDVDVVNGVKMERKDFMGRVIIGNAYAMAMRWLFLLPVWDVDCDFRLIRNRKLKGIKLRSNSGAICVELVKKLQKNRAKFRQVSVHHRERTYGSSQFFTPKRVIDTIVDLVSLWFNIMVLKR